MNPIFAKITAYAKFKETKNRNVSKSKFMIINGVLALSIFLAVGCSNSNSHYNYTYSESNETPIEVAATIFQAIKTGDKALWDKYSLNKSELQSGEDVSEQDVEKVISYTSEVFDEIRSDLENKNGIINMEDMRFLRAYYEDKYGEGKSLRVSDMVIEYAYQDHYIGAIGIEELHISDSGWKLGRLNGSRNRDISVSDLRPLGVGR